ncbi:hypothetical protein WDU94_000020 [Cyamophila willieti]
MVLNRITDVVDGILSSDQAGFRPGKSCCSQILNLTQFIEDGFEKNQVTGVAFIDLSAAYDTINHNRLFYKIYQVTKDYKLTSFVKCIMQNRSFYVSFQDKKSRWRRKKNGLAQGSVLAPTLYNIYSNDQPMCYNTRLFRYADDSAVAAQASTFVEVENILTRSLETLSTYFSQNHLRPNPQKTQVCAFHLKNRDAKTELKITWQGQVLEHCVTPKYLGVKLDRTLSFKQHCHDTKAEYAAPAWRNSAHAGQVDIAVNESARIITGCLKPTPLDKIYPIAGISPPEIRRKVCAEVEKAKQVNDPRHTLYGHQTHPRRLKSRKSFMSTTSEIQIPPEIRRVELWNNKVHQPIIELGEEISKGENLPYPTWRSLNRLRTGVGRCAYNMVKWKLAEEDKCECGAVQNMEHLLNCPNLPTQCNQEDLFAATESAIQVAKTGRRVSDVTLL